MGIHHIAFAASSRDRVDSCARRAAEHGAEIESGPKEYRYPPGYYAVFPHDLELEIVHRPTERDLARRASELNARVAQLEHR